MISRVIEKVESIAFELLQISRALRKLRDGATRLEPRSRSTASLRLVYNAAAKGGEQNLGEPVVDVIRSNES